MRVNAFEPTAAEIGDPFAAMARARAFREKTAPPMPVRVVFVPKPAPEPKQEKPKPVMDAYEIKRIEAEIRKKVEAEVRETVTKQIRFEYASQINELRSTLETTLESQIPMSAIIRWVCKQWGITPRDLMSKRRNAAIVLPRHIAMWYCRAYTAKTFPQIGGFFANRDHTVILHACNRIERLRQAGEFTPLTRDELIDAIKASAPSALCAENAG